MLEAAATQYNWNYMDDFDDGVDLRQFWLFMVWRLQSHGSIEQMIKEVCIAFPDLVSQFLPKRFATPERLLGICIDARFIIRFLQFWGFVTVDPGLRRKANIQPLMRQVFQFNVK